MLEQNSEAEDKLILRAKQGDRNAFGELVTRHYENVIRVVYRLCGDMQIAQDATQDAFIRAWVKLPGYQARAPFRHWIYRIAVNSALDVLRQKPEEGIENSEETLLMSERKPDPETAYIIKEQADFLHSVVRALPEAARTVLVLREYGELTYQEIASVLEIPLGTVMSRLNYARGRLRERFKEYRYEMENEYARSQ